MRKRDITIVIVLLSFVVFIIPADNWGQNIGAKKNMKSIETAYSIQASTDGIGVDQQNDVEKAVELIKQGKLAIADTILDGVLSRFSSLMGDIKKTYVCFRETTNYRQFLDEIQKKQPFQARNSVTRVHHSFVHALYMKAFIASSKKEWNRAKDYLNKGMLYAPYDSQPCIEMGYILNAEGRPNEAVKFYRKAYALALARGTVKTELAIALRGMGSALIELGKLDDATESFKKSLDFEPGNKTALNELQYIQQIKESGR